MARTASLKPKRGFLDGYKTYDTSNGFGDPGQWRREFNDRIGLDAAREAVGSKSPRSILGVSLSALWEEIRAAYRKLMFKYHPDQNPGIDTTMFRKVQGAYEILEAEFKR
jgi:hypothetical protein